MAKAVWRPAIAASEVPPMRIVKVTVEGVDLILLNVEGDIVAYHDRCPHEFAPLSEGALEEDVIVCARHLWEFETRTGVHVSRINRPDNNLKPAPVRVKRHMVEVDISALRE
jgi:toluene monooxygenase system ferredoxin subunit